MTIHNFQKSLQRGKLIEKKYDKIFSAWYQIDKVTLSTEKAYGYDRIFQQGGRELKVEYKADFKTYWTKNIFVETEVNGNPGWCVKTQADIVLYGVMDEYECPFVIYVIPGNFFRDNLDQWVEKYDKRVIQNTNFYGEGYLVPISEFKTVKCIDVSKL